MRILQQKFQADRKIMPTLTKIELTNLIIEEGKKHPELIDKNFVDNLFVYLIKESLSLYFFKCSDIIFVLEQLASTRFIKNINDFWYQIEDYLSRMKKDLSVTKAVRLVELY